MRMTIRALFFVAAVAFFVLVLVFEDNAFELLAIGLACMGAGELAGELEKGQRDLGDRVEHGSGT